MEIISKQKSGDLHHGRRHTWPLQAHDHIDGGDVGRDGVFFVMKETCERAMWHVGVGQIPAESCFGNFKVVADLECQWSGWAGVEN